MGLPGLGTYFIINEGTHLCMDLSKGVTEPNTPIIGYERTGAQNQMASYYDLLSLDDFDTPSQWIFEIVGDICTFRSILSMKAIAKTTGHTHVRWFKTSSRGKRVTYVII